MSLQLNSSQFDSCDELSINIWYDFDINPSITKFRQTLKDRGTIDCNFEFENNTDYQALVQKHYDDFPFEKALSRAEVRYPFTFYIVLPEGKENFPFLQFQIIYKQSYITEGDVVVEADKYIDLVNLTRTSMHILFELSLTQTDKDIVGFSHDYQRDLVISKLQEITLFEEYNLITV